MLDFVISQIDLQRECPCCGKVQRIVVDFASYYLWKTGLHIQKAFPELDANQREILISGICPECWDNMWGGDENDKL